MTMSSALRRLGDLLGLEKRFGLGRPFALGNFDGPTLDLDATTGLVLDLHGAVEARPSPAVLEGIVSRQVDADARAHFGLGDQWLLVESPRTQIECAANPMRLLVSHSAILISLGIKVKRVAPDRHSWSDR